MSENIEENPKLSSAATDMEEKESPTVGGETSKSKEPEDGENAESTIHDETVTGKTDAAKGEGGNQNQDQQHSDNVHYEGDLAIYTDPATKYQYTWDAEKSEWMPRNSEKSTDKSGSSPRSNPVDKSGGDSQFSSKDYQIDGDSYIYTDKTTGVTYRYDRAMNQWVKKSKGSNNDESSEESECDDDDKTSKKKEVFRQDMSAGHYSYEGDTHLYTDPNDGTVYEWDKEKNAWFPKVDEDFLAHYQMNYGFIDSSKDPQKEEEERRKKAVEEEAKAREEKELKRKAAAREPTWFEVNEEHNTKVYVSNLPLDITEEEFVAVMQKCGLVMRDVDTGKMKVKLYCEPGTNQLKGDALCTYIKIESVELALKVLDGYDLRGKKMKVERAKFQLKGDYDPNLKPKKKRKKDKEKLKKMQEKLFDWRPDKLRGERSKHERVVIIKNLFEPIIFEKDVTLLLEYQQDLREECSKCGDVRKVVIYDRHAEGVAQITFREPEEADQCVQLLNGRWFGQRKITAETWDGKTKYKVVETEEEAKKRLEKWNKFLETGKAELEKKENAEKEMHLKEDASSKQNETCDQQESAIKRKDEVSKVDERDSSDSDSE